MLHSYRSCRQLACALIVVALFGGPSFAIDASPVRPLPPGWSRAFGNDSAATAPTGQQPGVAQLPGAVDDMQLAADRLQATTTLPAAGESQRAALTKLDAALADLQRQCQQCMGGKCSKPSDKPSQTKPGSKRGGATPNGAVVSTGQGEAGAAAADAAQQAVRDLWGSLPERQRDEMLQPLREEFLPEYADDIEAYYRGLAEPTDDAGGRQ